MATKITLDGNKIKRTLEEKSLTQHNLAERAGYGLRHINRALNGTPVVINTGRCIAEVLGLPLDEMVVQDVESVLKGYRSAAVSQHGEKARLEAQSASDVMRLEKFTRRCVEEEDPKLRRLLIWQYARRLVDMPTPDEVSFIDDIILELNSLSLAVLVGSYDELSERIARERASNFRSINTPYPCAADITHRINCTHSMMRVTLKKLWDNDLLADPRSTMASKTNPAMQLTELGDQIIRMLRNSEEELELKPA